MKDQIDNRLWQPNGLQNHRHTLIWWVFLFQIFTLYLHYIL